MPKLLFSCEEAKARGKDNLLLLIRNSAALAESLRSPVHVQEGGDLQPGADLLCITLPETTQLSSLQALVCRLSLC